ncbi:MAG: hypothetical protein HY826_14890 [Actinobacteria bacterium]|nr:hypothetical protein [Actinomycetota bacterium]
MRVGNKLGLFAIAVAVAFGAAAAVGAALGPIDVGASSSHASMSSVSPAGEGNGLSGLSASADGYRLVANSDAISAGEPSTLTFRIENSNGSTTTDFEILHDRRMHLIVLSRNLVDYLHLHPTDDASGLWTVDVPALAAGSYRIYADFQPRGSQRLTLASDLLLPGLVEFGDLPAPAPVSEVAGLSVALSGEPATGESDLTFDVSRDGTAIVTDRYLGAAGHLVAIRTDDLGFLHVHPLAGDAGPVRFALELPTPGVYRLFFDFSVEGDVHTASFTIEVAAGESETHESHAP